MYPSVIRALGNYRFAPLGRSTKTHPQCVSIPSAFALATKTGSSAPGWNHTCLIPSLDASSTTKAPIAGAHTTSTTSISPGTSPRKLNSAGGVLFPGLFTRCTSLPFDFSRFVIRSTTGFLAWLPTTAQVFLLNIPGPEAMATGATDARLIVGKTSLEASFSEWGFLDSLATVAPAGLLRPVLGAGLRARRAFASRQHVARARVERAAFGAFHHVCTRGPVRVPT
mmetsp:Transcript_6770/g.22858  ORF Transcript_6770/g.22858 Transcript_6770/m.22858 type:complete len:225 (-) Transcript_6770:1898-2572(-)